MADVPLADLKEMSRRSRKAHSWGLLVVATAMLMVPALALVQAWRPAWFPHAALVSLLVTGALFVRYAHLVGESRGVFRRVFRGLRPVRKDAPSSPAEA